MTLYDKMVLRLYAGPFLLLVTSLIAIYFIVGIGDEFSGMFLANLGVQSLSFAPLVSGGLLASALGWAAYSSWLLWRWQLGIGKGACCHNCGGLVVSRIGRYGFYRKCLACGKSG